jgi:uncharacterized protein (DUF1330 family)
MRTRHAVAASLAAGIVLGAVAAQGLHAQSKRQVYTVNEAVTDLDLATIDEYAKDYVPLTQASIKAHGGKILAESADVVAPDGDPPKRLAIVLWRDMDAFQAWYNSADYRRARDMGSKYAKFRLVAVESLPQ